MAIVKAGTDTNGDQFLMGAGKTFTLAHTLVAGSDRKVVAYINNITDAWAPVGPTTGVTYGGNAMTLAIETKFETVAGSFYIEIWYIDEADLPANGSRDMVATYAEEGISVDIQMGYIAQYNNIASGVPDETDGVIDTDDNDTITNTMTSIPSTSWALSNVYKFADLEFLTWSDSQVEQFDGIDSGFGISHQGVAELQGGASETSLVTTSGDIVFGEWFRQVVIWGEPSTPSARNRILITG